MPRNTLTGDCLHTVGGAQLFMAPSWTPDQKGVKVQIVDVFALRLATGYEKDPTGRLLLQSEESVAQGRTWSLAKACQLVRNDAQPHRWVVLHRHKKAWGLFWAGGGLDLSRDQLAKLLEPASPRAIVPATPEALLRLVLEFDEPDLDSVDKDKSGYQRKKRKSIAAQTSFPWRAVAITSLVWLSVTTLASIFTAVKMGQQEAQIRKLLIEYSRVK